jgi:hypothetical protein
MRLWCLLAAMTFLAALAGTSQAQTGFAQSEINRLGAVSNPGTYSADRIRTSTIANTVPGNIRGFTSSNLLSGALARPNKPFSSISRGPSVTPYLALEQPFSNSATNYYTLVRPQLEQQRINQQMQRQTELMQRQISQVSAQPPMNPAGSQLIAPTGHPAVYMNYGGYYQTPAPRRR